MKDWFLKHIGFALIAYLALTLVFTEFLQIYSLDNQIPALVATGAICLILATIPYWWLRFPLALLAFLGGVYWYFPLGESFGLKWFPAIYRQVRGLLLLLSSEGLMPTPAIPALTLIFLGVLVMANLIVVHQHFWIPFIALILYELVLAVFNGFDPLWQVLLLISLMMLAFGLKQNVMKTERIHWPQIFGLLLCTVGIAAGAYFLPEQVLRKPVINQTTSLREYASNQGVYQFVEELGSGGNIRTGFDEDDSHLGGAMHDDGTVIFTAEQSTGHYWRVDSKDFYTGIGWENSETPRVKPKQNKDFKIQMFPVQETQPELVTDVLFKERTRYLPLPYGNAQVQLTNGFDGYVYLEKNQRVNLLPNNEGAREVKITYQEPNYTPEALRGTGVTINEEVKNYLQLPEKLPKRVKDLAKKIVGQKTNYYEQVKVIENYLKTDDAFRYSKVDAIATPANTDYVDQFLFETKVGYCDNFSSSMVILLRSLGIPSRWAKGFNQGALISVGNNLQTYQIRNEHAHSWPEVYFGIFGWVPFEPTPGFANPNTAVSASQSITEENNPEQSFESSTPTASSEATEDSTAATNQSTTQTSSAESGGAEQEDATESDWHFDLANFPWVNTFIGLVVISVIGGCFAYRFALISNFFLVFSKKPLEKSYPYVLKQAERKLTRPESEGLHDYAQRLERTFPEMGGDFHKLTDIYVGALYGNQVKASVPRQLIKTVVRKLNKIKSKK